MNACAHCLQYYTWLTYTAMYYIPVNHSQTLVRWRTSWFKDYYSRELKP